MGYFSNGTEAMMYQDQWCSRCKHDKDGACPVWAMHLLYNYDECNKKDSLLHKMIPQSEDGLGNDTCNFFFEDKEPDPPLRPGQVKGLKQLTDGKGDKED